MKPRTAARPGDKAQDRGARAGAGRDRRDREGQEGAAMIEMAFMLFFLSFMLLFNIYGYTLYETMTRTLEDLRYDWREKSEKKAKKDFQLISVDKTARLEVTGFVGDALDQRNIEVKLRLKGYAGSYTAGSNEYRNYFAKHGQTVRKINYE